MSKLAVQLGQPNPTPRPEMDELVAQCLRDSELDGTTKPEAGTAGDREVLLPALTPVLLSHPSLGDISVTGVALITSASGMRSPSAALVHAISQALIDINAVPASDQDGETTTATSPPRA